MNIEVNALGCYAKQTAEDKEKDNAFKEYCYTDAAGYADLRIYVQGKSLSGDYWKCIIEAVDHIAIPKPPSFIEKFNEINTNYDTF